MSYNPFIRKYWKQIDLHSHTLRGIDCVGNTDSGKYSHKCFFENLIEFGTQLQAVTNHNTLYLEDHIKHAIVCDLAGVSYIPGVEIDINLSNGEKPFHCVFLLGPNNDVCSFSARLNEATKTKQLTHNVVFNEEELSSLFSEMHFIYVFHGVKKKGLAESAETAELDKENINWVCQAVKNALAEPVLFENTKPKHVHTFINRFREVTEREDVLKIPTQQVTTSDYHFDNNKERLEKWKTREKYAICAEPTYEGLELSIRHYQTRFQLIDQIVEPSTFIEKIKFENYNNKKLKVSDEIEVSPYFNIIIGNSGSGKTLLLNEIFRSVNNYEGNLNAVITKENKPRNEKESVYGDYIGKGNRLLESTYYKGLKPIAVEIDKIYKRMLATNNPGEIAQLFNVSLPTRVSLLLQEYKTKVIQYEDLLSQEDRNNEQGNESLNSLKANIRFVNDNNNGEKRFLLSREVFDETRLNKAIVLLDQINRVISNKSVVESWFSDAKKFIPELNELTNNFVKDFEGILNGLKAKRIKIQYAVISEKLDKHFVEIYNSAADSINKIIGSKQVAVDKAKSTILQQSNLLRDSIIDALKIDIFCKNFDLRYPFLIIEDTAKQTENSKYARVTVHYSDYDKRFSIDNGEQQRIINWVGNSTKIKSALGNKMYSLESNADVKDMIFKFKNAGLVFSSLLREDVPFATELFDNKEWKNVQNINPGNLAKDYMTYYFNNVLETKRPNVVFIDQPENDVDKSFISKVLADFISNTKMSIQFFITSHEPILGVNADSNLIIEAYRYEDGPIGYRSKSFESKSTTREKGGKDTAAEILDGGKDNVIKRNQIYGGSIND